MRGVHSLVCQLACAVVAANVAGAQEKPQPLPTVPVTATTELIRSAKLREFDRRRSNGIGRFLTEADLARDQNKLFGDVIRRLPGTALVRARVRGVSSSGLFVISSRGSATLTHESAVFGKNCPVAIWLDGVPVYRGLDRNEASPAFKGVAAPGRIDEPPFDINGIMTNQVAAIEFYPGPATLPPEFNATQGTCGALVIWTK